ncbi:MAG: DUF72 domain-containing protein [Gemmatimonadota bacterium]
MRAGDRLGLYARAFDIVEVDSTFYAQPPVERFESWGERTPEGFLFTLKMPGEVTHELRLRDPRPALRFCEAARALGPKLGPILIQLPPDHGMSAFETTAAFVAALPSDLLFAVEFRDRAWLVAETRAMLREAGVSLALSIGPWLEEAAARSLAAEATDPLLYLRWLGSPRSGVPAAVRAERDRELVLWARLIPTLPVRDVYAFFNNDYQGHSPATARTLQSLLGQTPVPPRALSPQRELFE